MEVKMENKKSFMTFMIVVIILSVIIEALICLGFPSWLYAVLMWIPTISAVIANKGRIKCFRRCKLKYIIFSLLLPFTYIGIPYLIVWKVFPDTFINQGSILYVLIAITLGTVISMLTALGEEIGWRGYMFTTLNKEYGLNKALIVTSLFWCIWHLPLLIWGSYMNTTPIWYRIPAFILCIFPLGVVEGLITLKSNSVWPAAILHATHNNYDQVLFGKLTNGERVGYFVSETGFLTIIFIWFIAVFLYLYVRKENKNEKNI